MLLILGNAITPQENFLPSIQDTIVIKNWLVVGPFSTGAREGAVDYLVEHGGEDSIKPEAGLEHSSTMVHGGIVQWKKIQSEKGVVEIKYEGVSWDTLQSIYGTAGVLCAGYAYAEFDHAGDGRALAIAEGIGGFRLNGRSWPGDVYAHGFVRVPVPVKNGKNKILIKDSGYGDSKFTFKLIPIPAAVMVIGRDVTVPDIILRKPMKAFIGVPVVNTTDKRLRNIAVNFGDGTIFKKTETVIPDLVPYSFIKIPLAVELVEPVMQKPAGDTAVIPVTVMSGDGYYSEPVKFRVREPGASFKTTFVSKIDGSVQYFAVLPPKDYDSTKTYSLILSLHGAGVEAQGQVDAYSTKDWAFVVAPTNRRPYGFDWQDWGRLDALEVLAEMQNRYSIDENRIYLTGHSMGGHGTWYVGLHHPDRFAAIAPSAGWSTFKLYVPWSLQKSELYTPPEILEYRDLALREDQLPLFVENARNLPVFILHGGSDDNVPPIHGRFFAELLKKLNYEVVYKEVPGKGHWWTEEGIEGAACVNHPELVGFLKNHTRDLYAKHLFFKTTDLGLNSRNYWLQVIEQEIPNLESEVEASVIGKGIRLFTRNVSELAISLAPELVGYGEITISINGQKLKYYFQKPGSVKLYEKNGRFFLGEKRMKGLRKTPELFGPMKQAYFSPFILVYGTRGDSAATEANLHKARMQAFSWWRVGNGHTWVLPDTEVTNDNIKKYNLILFGGPETNHFTERINKGLPIAIKNGSIYLGKNRLMGDGLSVQFIYPNPLNRERFILVNEGSDVRGDKLSGFFGTLYSGAGLPDFIIYNAEVRTKVWGGVKACGFFDNNWRLKDGLMAIIR
jgi:poly(3-hydroxybutyrate) depolymerase